MKYYIDILLDDSSKGSPHKLDTKGVVMTKIPYTQSYHYHATAIASFALANLNDEKTLDSQIQWLVENMDKNGAYWHDFQLPYYDFNQPWVGGLAQGLAISALIRAYHKSNDKTLKESAFKALDGLEMHCLHKDAEGFLWISEFPDTPTILNGFIYALFGIYDMAEEGSTKAKKIWEECIDNLSKKIEKYDLGYWSRYDLQTGMPATLFYHNIHIKQMAVLAELTSLEIFLLFKQKWQHYLNNKYFHFRAKLKRNTLIIKKHGLLGSYKRYKQRKNWLER